MRTANIDQLAGAGRLKFIIKNKAVSQYEGGRRSGLKGRSTEFSGFREYIPGDDMRYVDWNAYGRLDKLFIKEYMEEREGSVNIFLDTSMSMDYGTKPKDELLAGLAQGIAYISDNERDSVTIVNLADPGRSLRLPKGRTGQLRLREYLSGTDLKGDISLSDAIEKASIGKHGLTFILSDFYDEDFLSREEELLKLLRYRRQEVVLLHIMSEEELEITDSGSFRLYDSERDIGPLSATFDRETVDRYEAALKAFKDRLRISAAHAGAGYFLCRTGKPLIRIILEDLRGLYDL